MSLNLDKCIEQLSRCEMLSEVTVKEICDKMKDILIDEPNVAFLKAPISVVGDISGQFFDLLEIFKVGGKSPDTNYLFLGNYVTRGHFGVETITLLICLKLRFPNRITLLRGSHDSRLMTQLYGFYGECIRKYGNANVWKYITDVFEYFALAAVIEDKYFCVHGGISPSISTLDQIKVMNRFTHIGTHSGIVLGTPEGPLADLLWSDPDPDRDGFTVNTGSSSQLLTGMQNPSNSIISSPSSPLSANINPSSSSSSNNNNPTSPSISSSSSQTGTIGSNTNMGTISGMSGLNSTNRGVGCMFGQAAVNNFLKVNKLEAIIRSHQVCMDGYQVLFNGKVTTIWSAPNYCYRCGNVGAILEISENLERSFNTFTACPDFERLSPSFDSFKETPDYYL